jgi:8-oxo-dGTP diphosphatase
MPLLVVRHAHAGRRSAYQGDDRLRPLSPRGRDWAQALVPLLTPFAPTRVLSSPFVRCIQTVMPTARALDLDVETADALSEGHGPEAFPLLEGLAGRPALLCTHGDVALELLGLLRPGARKPPPPSLRLQKGDVWVVDGSGSSLAIVDHIRRADRRSPSS